MKSRMGGLPSMACIWVLASIVLATGCTTLKSDEPAPAADAAVAREGATVYHDFGDVMVPRQLKVNQKDSFIIHSAGTTSGVLVLSGNVDANSLVSFFENKMPLDGWRKTGSFRSARSLVLFSKQTRWCVISVSEGRFRTHVEIWVAPTLNEAGMTLTR